MHSPLDLKPGHTRLVIDIPYEFIKFQEPLLLLLSSLLLLVSVDISTPRWHPTIFGFPFRVLIIPHPDELLIFVAPGQDQRRDAQDVLFGYLLWVWRATFELESVYAYGDGSDETVVELLIEVFVTR